MPFNNQLPTYESLLQFQEVYLQAVALSWKDEEFKRQFTAQPELALQHYLGYKCPWNLTLKVTEVAGGGSDNYGWNTKVKDGWHLPDNSLTFGIPVVPEVNDEVCVALAAYNDAGPTYLFTCC
jgi:ribosomally synthesized peptide (two-chain TOMM family)